MRRIKKLLPLTLALIMALTLAACGSVDAPSDATTTPSGGDASASPSQADTSDQTSDTTDTMAGTANDGDFLQISVDGASNGLFGATVEFVGDTRFTHYLDIAGFAIYVNGEAQPFDTSNIYYLPGRYFKDTNVTQYAINFYETWPETAPIEPQVGEVWVEAVINGASIRSATHEWNENGNIQPQGGASVSSPLSLTAISSYADGELIYLGLPGLNYFNDNDSDYDSFYGASAVFKGDTSELRKIDVSDFTIYINGEALPYNAGNIEIRGGEYSEEADVTVYRIIYESVGMIQHQTADLWIEAIIHGAAVRSATHQWGEDKYITLLDDASINEPLQLEILPPLTLEEFYALHYIKDEEIPDNGTSPDMPEWLEHHRGDRGYFFVTSDDYIIKKTVSPEYTTYLAYSFVDGICVEYVFKRVYVKSSEEMLAEIFETYGHPQDYPRDVTMIDNVRYTHYEDEGFTGLSKSDILRSLVRDADLFGNEFYDSKP